MFPVVFKSSFVLLYHTSISQDREACCSIDYTYLSSQILPHCEHPSIFKFFKRYPKPEAHHGELHSFDSSSGPTALGSNSCSRAHRWPKPSWQPRPPSSQPIGNWCWSYHRRVWLPSSQRAIQGTYPEEVSRQHVPSS